MMKNRAAGLSGVASASLPKQNRVGADAPPAGPD